MAESEKERFIEVYEQEYTRTVRVLNAYPVDKLELRPHPKSKTARELAWIFVTEQRLCETAITKGFDWSVPPSPPTAPPDTMAAILDAFEIAERQTVELLRSRSEAELHETTQFFIGPKTLADVSKLSILWLMLHDQIHHRGQFSVYLRMADGRVPAIYGPSLDEPWI